MKNFRKILKNGVLVSIFSVLVLPTVSFAQIQIEVLGQADMNTGAYTDGSLEANTYSVLDMNGNPIIQIEGGIDSKAELKREDNINNTKSGTSFRLNADGVAITTSNQVRTEADLEIFTDNMVRTKNRVVAKVDIDARNDGGADIELSYHHKGKFLGFIPVNVPSYNSARVKNDGALEFKTTLPWWKFMVKGVHYNKHEIESRIKNNVQIQASAQSELSAHTKAELAEMIATELDAYFQAQTEAQATLS